MPEQRSRRTVPPGSFRAPPVFARVCQRVAGVAPRREDLERLYIAAHTLSGTSASYGFPQFSEIAGEDRAHLPIRAERHARRGHARSAHRISIRRHFVARNRLARNQRHRQRKRRRHRLLQGALSLRVSSGPAPRFRRRCRRRCGKSQPKNPLAERTGSYSSTHLPLDDEVGPEILEFFQPEAEEHLQVVSECLISLEGNTNAEEINRLFRAIHTVKGSAAQVGLKRLGAIAHRVEDLIGRLRDGEIEPQRRCRRSSASNPSTY